ncbi:MAG: RHS repeat-associated core domain-containing protein [Reinekea sp.]
MNWQWEDLETGLYQNLHRFYDPHCGRYINHDPIGLMGGLNQYCPNPVGWVDPLGLKCKEFNEILKRTSGIISKYGGTEVDGGYQFPSKKSAKQAASEVLGNMGNEPAYSGELDHPFRNYLITLIP